MPSFYNLYLVFIFTIHERLIAALLFCFFFLSFTRFLPNGGVQNLKAKQQQCTAVKFGMIFVLFKVPNGFAVCGGLVVRILLQPNARNERSRITKEPS